MAIDLTPLLEKFLKPIGSWIKSRYDPSRVVARDFKNAKNLAAKLLDPQDPMSRYINSRLEHAKLKAYVDDPGSHPEFRKYLCGVLNKVIKEKSLSELVVLNRDDLSEETKKLLNQESTLHAEDTVRLNRLILEDTYPREITRGYLPRPAKWAIFLLLPLSAGLAITGWYPTVKEQLLPRDTSRYGFEDTDRAPGWVVSKEPEGGLAILPEPGVSTDAKAKGDASMLLRVELDGTAQGRQAGKHKGEVFVDPTVVRARGYDAPLQALDLSNKTLRASVIVPTNKLVGKDPSRPVFAQMFLQSCDPPNRRFDSAVKDIPMAGQLDLEYRTGDAANRVCRIGIKIGLNDGDQNVYAGDIYIDAVDW